MSTSKPQKDILTSRSMFKFSVCPDFYLFFLNFLEFSLFGKFKTFSRFLHTDFQNPVKQLQPLLIKFTVTFFTWRDTLNRLGFKHTMGVCYRSSYPSLSLNWPPLGAEPLAKEQTSCAAGASLMMLWCHMSNLIACWVDWHFRWRLLATALQVVGTHLAFVEGTSKC